mgnify:CR=1 FL=1
MVEQEGRAGIGRRLVHKHAACRQSWVWLAAVVALEVALWLQFPAVLELTPTQPVVDTCLAFGYATILLASVHKSGCQQNATIGVLPS